MLRKTIFLFVFVAAIVNVNAQEIQARLTIITNKISTQVDKKIFQTLQTALTNFINNRKWTKDVFQPNEKIQCSFLLSLETDAGNNVYKGKMTVQAARPIFNSTYDSPIINFQDDNISLRYVEFQPIEFNENRIQGSDPLAANISAILAYYVNIILGFDYDSFSLRGGDEFFKKAWNIVNNAPEAGDISGWKPFEGQRNRYWLCENMNNNRYTLMHDAVYAYYRSGMDMFYENQKNGRDNIMKCLNYLSTINTENPNSMILPFFFQGKSAELVKIFSRADGEMKIRAREILQKLDITNTAAYKELK